MISLENLLFHKDGFCVGIYVLQQLKHINTEQNGRPIPSFSRDRVHNMHTLYRMEHGEKKWKKYLTKADQLLMMYSIGWHF